jgi:hypothetical protein
LKLGMKALDIATAPDVPPAMVTELIRGIRAETK